MILDSRNFHFKSYTGVTGLFGRLRRGREFDICIWCDKNQEVFLVGNGDFYCFEGMVSYQYACSIRLVMKLLELRTLSGMLAIALGKLLYIYKPGFAVLQRQSLGSLIIEISDMNVINMHLLVYSDDPKFVRVPFSTDLISIHEKPNEHIYQPLNFSLAIYLPVFEDSRGHTKSISKPEVLVLSTTSDRKASWKMMRWFCP